MRIKQVRYVDKPFSHVLKCSPYSDKDGNQKKWAKMRGQHVLIEFPMIPDVAHQWEHYVCQGPFYRRATAPDFAICIHLIDWLAKEIK